MFKKLFSIEHINDLYNSRGDFQIVRVAFLNGDVIDGLKPAGVLDQISQSGPVLWADLIDGEWIDAGDYFYFSPVVGC